MTDYSVDLTKKDACAVFLPAVSSFYTEILARAKTQPGYLSSTRTPTNFENGFDGINFLDHNLGYFKYNYCLYSAGHAYWDMNKSRLFDGIVQNRDRTKVQTVGDSGGFQIGKGTIKFDWENFYEKKGDVGYKGSADKTRLDILNWLEETAEWSMTLDVPSWAAKNPTSRAMTGFKDEADCLKATLFNLDFFMQHKKGKTKWLNVLQGTEWEDSQTWYDAVKDYDCQGWAMGGNNMRDMDMALRRLLVMRDEGKLEGKDWIHFLGTSKLEWAVMLTAVQRQLRKHVNPNLTISFDCASPFVATANGLAYTYNILTSDRFSYIMDSCFDNKDLKDSSIKFPFESEVGRRITAGDICVHGKAHALINNEKRYDVSKEEVEVLVSEGIDAVWVEADLNKIGKEGKTSWDSLSYALIMAHNTEMHIKAVQRANYLADIEYITKKPDWRLWTKVKKKDKSKEISQWVPRNTLYFMNFVEELFVSKDPFGMLDNAKEFLKDLSNNRHYSNTSRGTFNALFDTTEILDKSDDTTFDEQDPDSIEMSKLNDLEGELKS